MTQRRLWLLLLPYVGLLWVAFYNFRDPTLFGFLFFYWYQLAWVPLSALLTWIAYQTYMRPTQLTHFGTDQSAIMTGQSI
jgi:uncharacterized protein DUF3311